MPSLTLNARLQQGNFVLEVDDTLQLSGVTGVLGGNGAGKTTLLRVLAGLEPAAKGRVQFGAVCWQDSGEGRWVPPHKRRVGLVFQDARLFPHLTVAGNLDFASQRASSNTVSRDEVVAALALDNLMSRTTEGLSGGERQRVALARALMSSPQLLLLDEPLAAADMGLRADLLPYLRRVIEQFTIPTLYVAHALDELTQLADQLLVIREGRWIAHGPVADIVSRLDLPEVSAAEQASGILDGEVVVSCDADGLTEVSLDGQRLVLALPGYDLSEGDRARVRVYASDVAVATQRPAGISIRNVLAAEVLAVEASGPPPFAEVLLSIGGQKLRARLTRAAVRELGLNAGQSVFALLKAASLVRQ